MEAKRQCFTKLGSGKENCSNAYLLNCVRHPYNNDAKPCPCPHMKFCIRCSFYNFLSKGPKKSPL